MNTCQSADSDHDNDGWGWENNASCRVATEDSATQPNPMPQGSTIPACQSLSADPDGDGWGWENSATCRVVPEDSTTQPNPMPQGSTILACQSKALILMEMVGDGKTARPVVLPQTLQPHQQAIPSVRAPLLIATVMVGVGSKAALVSLVANSL